LTAITEKAAAVAIVSPEVRSLIRDQVADEVSRVTVSPRKQPLAPTPNTIESLTESPEFSALLIDSHEKKDPQLSPDQVRSTETPIDPQ
jgi:hypothetical protein